jgi:uncharacterized ion transporter superfamily protein YfcC
MNTTRARDRKRLLPIILIIAVICAVAGAWIVPAAAQKTKKQSPAQTTQSSLKDVLMEHRGELTNLGTVTKIVGDYFVVEDEGGVSMHPLSAIHTLRVVKAEEGSPAHLEIRLIAKD